MDLEITQPDGSTFKKTGVDVETVKKIVDALKPLGAEDRLKIIDELSAKLDLGDIRALAHFQGRVEVGRHGQAGYSMTPEVEKVLGITTEPRRAPSPSLDEFMSREIGPVEIAPEVQRVFDEHNQWCEGQGGQLPPLEKLDDFVSQEQRWDAAARRLAAMDEETRNAPDDQLKRVIAGAKKVYGTPENMMLRLDQVQQPTLDKYLDLKTRSATVKADLAKSERKIVELENEIELMESLRKWISGPLVLEKPQGSAWHKVTEAERSGQLLTLKTNGSGFGRALFEGVEPALNVFVVEHDWAKAFEGAQDFGADGETRLPFDHCLFEFRISGRRVCVLLNQELMRHNGGSVIAPIESGRRGIVFVSGPGDWWITIGPPDSDGALANLISTQVHAVAVALDAEVAETEVERAPHKLNQARAKKGLAPLKDYHVVSLVRRSRAAPLPRTGVETGRRVRLHFRRGHWRHYGDATATCAHVWRETDPSGRAYCHADCGAWRTWLKWQLVGNPDLGFIDKHYKL